MNCIFFATISCYKEPGASYKSDSLTIARIFRPDPISGKDAFVESISPDHNNGNISALASFAWTDTGYFNSARALISFDLSSIPAGTQIKSAKLSLYYQSYFNLKEQTGENSFSIFKINQNWDENTVTWNSQPQTSHSDSINVSKSKSVYQSYTDMDVTRFVQDMINYPEDNYGLMLKLNNEFPYKLVILASSDATEETKRPKLIIYF